ncbi:helix-turn-helix domain-containing protein [Pantoea vagans]|uniref:helix-turn-helix domain-containing protein n=1 Tax=Pantoea vagans TaxID=470934 RepID=UPI0028EA983F|nr:helix-turn-helix domain-containing protein [Pantoea vagans]
MKSFTRDLIVWIEDNLDKKITLDEVAEKSGYSKWHLQRLFRQETGMNLATYIRERRLSESAILLKMTGAPVIHAAAQFGFTNQQAFTRAFTRYFCQPPARYRQTEEWHFHGLQPSLLSTERSMPEPETTWLSAPALSDVTFSYQCESADLYCVAFHTEQREQGLKKAARLFRGQSPTWFAERYEPDSTFDNIRLILTFGFHEDKDERGGQKGSSPGMFLHFPFEGSAAELTELQMHAYRHILPRRAEARRDGHDLFFVEPDNEGNLMSSRFRGHYYIPVSAALCEAVSLRPS